MTTSRWMWRSTSWIKPSIVALTVPSIPFSMGTNPRSTSSPRDGVEDRRDGAERRQIGQRQVGLGQQRLLGEGGRRAEVGHRGRRGVHSWAG